MEARIAKTIGKFSYEDSIHGLRFTALSNGLSAGCLTGTEIDEYCKMLKADLDAVAKKMKVALKDRPKIDLREAKM